MSWALEEWKEGLPTRALQKIQELEGQLDKLKKERQQRQFQLETLEAALQKQKQKVENEKTEGINLKRENQSLMEICENLEKTKQKIAHDLQVKESQVNFQGGQLNSSKKQIEKLEQELKRCKSELERSQQAVHSADISLNPCSTPQKMFATSLTPSHYYSGSKYEDLKEKYDKEVEERKKLEAEVKVLQAKRASQPLLQSTMNHRDIARHQASSSVFSWQQEATPSRLSSSALKTPSGREFSASHFSAECEGTPSRWTLQTGKRDTNSGFCENSSNSQLLDQLKAQNQELWSKIQELELRLQGQEKELKGQGNKFQELHLQLEKAKVQLTEKEKVLNKNRDELVRTTAQYDQAFSKCTALEQKLKKLTEDLSCQRQNAESARCSLEQRSKEKEKEFQEELFRQQRALQSLEQEGTQVKARLTQELQQARSAHDALQADLDRVTAIKHQLEKSLEEFKHKFCRTEQALQASQTREDALKRSMEELKKESGLVRGQLEQRTREVGSLAEELRAAQEALSQSQRLAKETRAKNMSQEAMLRDLQEKISQQENSLTLEKLKLTVADLEKQRDCSQDLLKKREHHIEQLNEKLSRTEHESQTILSMLELKHKECEQLRQEKTQFSCWKSENEQRLHQMESERESLQGQISHLETCLKTQQAKSEECSERLAALELERGQLGAEVGLLQTALDSKAAEMGVQQQACAALQQQAESSDQKHRKEMENMCWKVAQLTGQVEDLEHQLQVLSAEIVDRDQRYSNLSAECESLRGRVHSRDSPRDANAACDRSLLAFEQQAARDNSFANIIGEQESLPSERSGAAQSPPNSAILQNKVIALEGSLESQKQMNSDLQKQCEELVQMREKIEENLIKAEQMHQDFVAETSQRISKLQEDASAHKNVMAETLGTLKDKEKEMQLLTEQFKAQKAETQEIRGRNHLLEDSLKELQVLSETLSLEKKEMNSVISLHKKEIHELTQENGRLKEVNVSLSQEKMDLLRKSESFSLCIDEKEKRISELSSQYKQERLTLLQRCEETGSAFEELSEKYKAGQEKSSQLERLLSECTSVCENRKMELEQLKETFAREHQACVAKLALAEERNQCLELELEAVRPGVANFLSHSQSEADAFKQEILTLKEEQSEMQKEVRALSREKVHLRELAQIQREYHTLEPCPPMTSECGDALLQADLGVKGSSRDSYGAQLRQLEAQIRNLELRLQESELEKERLRQETQAWAGSEARALAQDAQPPEASGLPDCDMNTGGTCTSAHGEWLAGRDCSTHLHDALQAALSKLAELETVCGSLRVEKLQLLSELDVSRSECVAATSKMAAEVEKLVSEVRTLNHESSLLHGELVTELREATFGAKQESASLGPLDDSSFGECLTSSSQAVQAHFAELQARFSSLQSEHRALHDQHCQVSSKMAALQAYVDELKAENSALCVDLRDAQGDLVKEVTPRPGEGLLLSSSFSSVCDSPRPVGVEGFFYKDLVELTEETSLLSHSDGDALSSSLGEEALAPGDPPLHPGGRVEELETLCQAHLHSLRQLEEKMESQGLLRNKEIQELQHLLGSERNALEGLRREYLSEKEQWQQQLASVMAEMESKLAAEKKQTEHLSLELEAARLQLQGLDLSSRSLLGTDLVDAARGSEGCERVTTSESSRGAPKHVTHGTCEDQQDRPELEGGTLPGALRLPEDSPGGRPAEGRAPSPPAGGPEPSPSGPSTLDLVDFLGGQVTTENLQVQVQEMSNENVRLLHAIEERDQRVEGLLGKMKELDSKLKQQEAQLADKIAACLKLEQIVEQLKKEKSELSEKLEPPAFNNQESHQGVGDWEGLGCRPGAGTEQQSQEVSGESAVPENAGWRERFLAVEKELERMSSQHAGLERQALSLGADLERVQMEKLSLEEDNANKRKVIACLEQELSVVTRKRNQPRREVGVLSKESEDLDLTSVETEDSAPGAPGPHPDMAQGPSPPRQMQSSEVAELSREKAHLQEWLRSPDRDAQALSTGQRELEGRLEQLAREREWLVGESERLQAQLIQSDDEKLRVSRALEAALLEKVEVAGRLSSTQGEVRQLRRGIEALQVRIEADQQKQSRVSEQLRDSERRADALQDRVERLEQELQVAEESQELVIMEAENAKAEVETLKTQVEEMAGHLQGVQSDLAALRSDRENLVEQLQEERGHVSESDAALSSLKRLLEEKEQESAQMAEESRAAADTLCKQLMELQAEVAALCSDQETPRAGGQNMSSPEAHPLRAGIQQLKDQLQADAKRQLQVLGQLKESEHQADWLRGQVADLQEELEAAGQKHEQAAREAETLRAKLEEMALGLRVLELELVNRKAEKEDLSKELQEEHRRVSELEALNASLENLLQEKEQEKEQMKEESQTAVDMLQAQLKEQKEKVAASCHELEAQRAREQELSLCVEALKLEKTQLRRGLQEAECGRVALQSSVNGLLEEVGDGKQRLEKKEEEIRLLNTQIQDREQLVSKLSQVAAEQRRWQELELQLGTRTEELEQRTQALQSHNDTLQDTLEALRMSHQDLERELESAKVENVSLVEKVDALVLREMELQREVQELAQRTTALKEEFSGEKSRLTEELKLKSEEIKNSDGQLQQLLQENSELKKCLDSEHKMQLEKEGREREEVAALERRLCEAEQTHQALLDARKQSEMEIQAYREKLASNEERLSSQQVELGLLKSSKEELSCSLAATTQLLEKLERGKMDNLKYANQLKKENERAQGKIKLLIKSCKQLEQEKEALQKELAQCSTAEESQGAGATADASAEELAAEMKELKETLEAKSKEADEYLDKYCALLISHEKLETAKEMLETQLNLLRAQPVRCHPHSPLPDSAVLEPSPSPPAWKKELSFDPNKASGKRQRLSGIQESGGATMPSTPETFSKKSRRAVHSSPHPTEDMFEPEGLPEVVKKGFANIPTGKTSPYVLRRTTLATRSSPRLAAQKLPSPRLSLNKENQAEPNKPAAAGSRSQKVKVAEGNPVEPGAALRGSANSLLGGLMTERDWPAPHPEVGPEAPSGENCRVQ
ncbi:centromere protein F [Talpa occidentalis]|uniref:centromere protein F n=1 Tax=Talpa occidentalis TaxID=50954 RepID=UPI0018900B59|nr:centromere protein F [Talpa occidentalis]XP_037353851.1 centromere protein F [Talpa occidentalis]